MKYCYRIQNMLEKKHDILFNKNNINSYNEIDKVAIISQCPFLIHYIENPNKKLRFVALNKELSSVKFMEIKKEYNDIIEEIHSLERVCGKGNKEKERDINELRCILHNISNETSILVKGRFLKEAIYHSKIIGEELETVIDLFIHLFYESIDVMKSL